MTQRLTPGVFVSAAVATAQAVASSTMRPKRVPGSVGLRRDFLSSAGLPALLSRFEAGDFDLVALGRVLLGNPSWVRLAAAGRLDEIRDYRKADEDIYH